MSYETPPDFSHLFRAGETVTLCGLSVSNKVSLDISKTVTCPYCRDNGGIDTYYYDARAEIVKKTDKIL
jgi:hypothetical protein